MISLGVGIWSAIFATTFGFLVALAISMVLVLLALVAQEVAQRSGALERDRLEEEQMVAEIEAWPTWKKVAFLVVALLGGVGVLALGIWADTWR